MLLSLVMSFLLLRRFKGKAYVLFTAIALFLISLFSVGVPYVREYPASYSIPTYKTIEPRHILPLSFPFRGHFYYRWWWGESQYYLYFLTFEIMHFGGSFMGIDSGIYILLFSFFLLFNLLGAILGYWIEKLFEEKAQRFRKEHYLVV